MSFSGAVIAELGARLRALRSELETLSSSSAEGRAPVTLDQQAQGRLSRMDAMRAQAMDKATEAKRRAEIRRIDAALTRMEEGEYGYCASCGDAIAEKRLRLDPAAAACVQCASGR